MFKIDYEFSQHQQLSFLITDVDDRVGDADDFLGKAIVSLSDLVASKANQKTIPLMDQGRAYCGELIIHIAKEVPDHEFVSW